MTWQPANIARRLWPLREAASYPGLRQLASEFTRLDGEMGRRRG
jgi:hypothetical protein